MTSTVLLHGINLPAFNALRFLFLSVILIPLFEAAIARIFRITCALRLLGGKTAQWNESNLGYLAMHGKYYSQPSRIVLCIISTAAIGMYLLLEYGTSATSYDELAPVQLRKTAVLRPGTVNRETVNAFIKDIDAGATLEFLRASLRLTGQRSTRYKIDNSSNEDKPWVPQPRPWVGQPVKETSNLCFQKGPFCPRCEPNSYNGSLARKAVRTTYQSTELYSDVMNSSYDMSSLHRAMHLRRDSSILFVHGAENLAVNFKVQLFTIERDLRIEDGAYYHKSGTPHSADEFVKRFGRFGIRTTLRKTILQTRSYGGYVSFAVNRYFRCMMVGIGTVGNTLCRLSVFVGDNGEQNALRFLDGDTKEWDQSCATNPPNTKTGKCISFLLGGTIVSDSIFNATGEKNLGYVHVLLLHVFSSAVYEGKCVDNDYGTLLITRDANVRNILTEESVVSIGAVRRLVLWPVVFSMHERAILKDKFETVNLPVSSSLVPTVSMSFLGIVSGIALFVVIEGICTLGLLRLKRTINLLPPLLRRVTMAKRMQIRGTFRYALAKMSTSKRYSCAVDEYEDVTKLRNQTITEVEEHGQTKEGNHLALQTYNDTEKYFVAICDNAGTVWDGKSSID